MTPLCACGEPAPSSTICKTCERKLTIALIVAALRAPDLELAVAKQAQFGDRTPSRGYNVPLPYDPHVAERGDHLRGVLVSWVRDLTEART